MTYTNFEDLKKEILKNPAAKKAYDDLELEFSIIDQIIKKQIEHGISYKELLKRLGPQRSSFIRLYTERFNPTIGLLEKIAKALDSKLEIKFK